MHYCLNLEKKRLNIEEYKNIKFILYKLHIKNIFNKKAKRELINIIHNKIYNN